MRWILEVYNYNIGNGKGKNNKFVNIIDCIFCVVYTIISLINAVMGIGTLTIFNKNNQNDVLTVVKSVFLITVNIIVLLRLNIKLYIKGKETEENALKKISDANSEVAYINVNTWNKRIQLIKYVYVADVVIIVMNFLYKSTIETSLSAVVIFPIIVTFINNFIDIAENMYQATPKIVYQYAEETIQQKGIQ